MRMTGKVIRLSSDSSEACGYIQVETGRVYGLLGRHLSGYYLGQNLYEIGLIDGATVSFDVTQESDMALNIKVENKPNKFFLAFLASKENLIAIAFLSACICAVLIFKKIAACLLAAVLFLWIMAACHEIYEKFKSILG